ncbi:DUF3618 domain-containing protein [Micromonospora sp. NBC_01796]|uniref:DUF3618 domain-containing protein n=1 Tax=Micromonospora sp. NBC_01796 TaxID=2975987 RepID=UPI002DD89E49|nr:DUF3618 domain-containing protein [Micromonospora sp. NBC_01796]WSA86224.1 DUF3618 domain-containing protein [Micromonospora sp. NBC_01796]
MTLSNGHGDHEALRDEIRQTRAELAETVQALANKADVKARIKGSAAQVTGRLRGQAGQVRAQAGERADEVRSSVSEANRAIRRRPVPWGAGVLAAATLAAAIAYLVVRRSRR